MASPLARKFHGDAVARMERTPIPATRPLSERLMEPEDRVLPPRPAVHRQLDFSPPAASTNTTDMAAEMKTLKTDNDQLRQQMEGITDMLAQILAQQSQTHQQNAQPPAQPQQPAAPATQPNPAQPKPAQHSPALPSPAPDDDLTDTVKMTAAKAAASFLAGGKPNDRTTALSSINVEVCSTTLKKYKHKITTVEQLAAKVKTDYPAWDKRLTAALQKRGAPCRDDLLGMYNAFAAEFTITQPALATAAFWCAITDPDTSPKASVAAGVLRDFLHTTDPMALMKNCKQGLTGTAAGVHCTTTRACGDLTTLTGWHILLTATLAAFGYSTTVTQQVKQMIREWRTTKQQQQHLHDFLQDFQEKHSEITRICEQGGCGERIPTDTDCLDVLRDAIQPNLLQRAEYRLMQIKDMAYDDIDYIALKAALIKVQRDDDESCTPTKPPAKRTTTTPKKPPALANTDLAHEQQQAELTQALQQHGLCLFNVAGQCKKGGECPYKHATPEEVGLNPTDYIGYQPATRFLKKKDDDITIAPATTEKPQRSAAVIEECDAEELKVILKLKPGDPRRAEFLTMHHLTENYIPKKGIRKITGPGSEAEEAPTMGPALTWPIKECEWISETAEPSCFFE